MLTTCAIENNIKADKNTLTVRLGVKDIQLYHALFILIVIFLFNTLFSMLNLHHLTGWLLCLINIYIVKLYKESCSLT